MRFALDKMRFVVYYVFADTNTNPIQAGDLFAYSLGHGYIISHKNMIVNTKLIF
jgi:hypothetical protein